MNREIKFRAWDKKNSQMLIQPIGTIFGLKRLLGLLDDTFILMQFTGLKDRNGKEIYEGDIVSLKSQYETEYPIDTKSMVLFSDGFFHLDFHALALTWAVLNYTKSNWLIEVIGDIYSNPELLKEGRDE